jgi:hypothetical protein
MILLWGIESEPPVRLAIEAAQRAGVDHVVLNQRSAADDDLEIDLATGSGRLHTRGRVVDLGAVSGVYVRIMDPGRVPGTDGSTESRSRAAAMHEMLLTWLDFAPAGCRVANPTAAMATNGSKPYQAQLIVAAGFDVPETLVTDDLQSVKHFDQQHGPLVFKSTSAVRSIVRPLDPAARGRLGRLRWLPVQFQHREQGDDVRVHVVGGRVLAARASTEAVDYRYASRDGHPVSLEAIEVPSEVAERCLALSGSLGLPFCGIDLMARPDGSWVCFEVNPSPGYSWYEEAAGLPISDALVAWLAHED